MKKMIKLVIGAVVALLVLVVIAVVVALWQMNAIAKVGIEAGGSYALGAATTVDKVSISLLGGKVGIYGMNVANPEGFSSENITSFKSFDVAVDTRSLFEDVIVVPSIELNDLTMNIEKANGKTNVDVIVANLNKLGSGTADAPKEEGGPSKKVKVGKIAIHNITANVQLMELGGKASTVHVNIPELVLDNVSSDDGVPMAEVVKRIWPAVLAAIVAKGGDIIPTEMLKDLNSSVGSLAKNLGGNAAKLIGSAGSDITKQLENITGDVGKNVGEGIGKILGGDKSGDGSGANPVDEGTKKITEGLGNLLGGDKK